VDLLELLQPKEKRTGLCVLSHIFIETYVSAKITISIKPQAYGKANMPT